MVKNNDGEKPNDQNHNGLDGNGEEITEELLVESVPAPDKNRKKLYLLLGAVAVILVLAGMALFIPTQMKASEISKSLELGDKYLEEGKYEEAIIAFDDVIAIDTKNVSAYEGKGASYTSMDNYAEAEAQLETAKSIEYTDNGKVLMADVYIHTDRKDQGLALVEEVVNHQPEDTKTIIQITDLYAQVNENTKTIDLLEKQIANTKDKEELKKLYDALIPACVKAGKSDAEIQALLAQAASSIGEYTNAFYQNYAYYAPILNEYREAEASKFSYSVIKNLPHVTNTFASQEYDAKVFYMIEDLSGDSIPELVIAGYNPGNVISPLRDAVTKYNLIDTYRLVDGKPERIFGGSPMGVRAQYTICENNIIKMRGSGGAVSGSFIFYQFDGNTTLTNQTIMFDGNTNPYYFLTDATHDKSQLTKEEAFTIINSYIPRNDINWIPLS